MGSVPTDLHERGVLLTGGSQVMAGLYGEVVIKTERPEGSAQDHVRTDCNRTGDLSAPRILMAGFDESVGDALRSALGEGCFLTRAADARGAVEELGHHGTDILIMDYPANGGTASDLSEQANRAGIPVLWMHADPAEVRALGDVLKAVVRATRRS